MNLLKTEARGGIQNTSKIRDARFSEVDLTQRGDRVEEYPFITRKIVRRGIFKS